MDIHHPDMRAAVQAPAPKPQSTFLGSVGLGLLIFAALIWAGQDDSQADTRHRAAAEQAHVEAAEERRAAAAARACEPGTTPAWIDSTTVQCLRAAR
ncbi:hypothetical protein [Paracidovorax cattleyae]|uniref:Uncharacterized protein n=1 Tax=Paracidovorax cattleyae TaxID=80868 RepID=A0A1H0RFP5_9BURK|nr:hypothetical protein [Paracidovorax cattleyae]SDP28210.1 hypothetical protein SAMN04489708_11039 [Paracidovorax cattleyae]